MRSRRGPPSRSSLGGAARRPPTRASPRSCPSSTPTTTPRSRPAACSLLRWGGLLRWLRPAPRLALAPAGAPRTCSWAGGGSAGLLALLHQRPTTLCSATPPPACAAGVCPLHRRHALPHAPPAGRLGGHGAEVVHPRFHHRWWGPLYLSLHRPGWRRHASRPLAAPLHDSLRGPVCWLGWQTARSVPELLRRLHSGSHQPDGCAARSPPPARPADLAKKTPAWGGVIGMEKQYFVDQVRWIDLIH